MRKATVYNIADSNIALLGSELEKKVKAAAANTEPAWFNAGQEVGLQIWRIEKFTVVSRPKETYGEFFDGDSYIVLNTYKKNDALAWDVHFWLGEFTTQDEAGTAAYKTVELDDKLGGAPVQHREVSKHESKLFLSYFPAGIRILEGGVDSGFRHVEAEKYTARLLQIKGTRKNVRASQVPLATSSLNSGDVFILDNGLTVYQWTGASAGVFEKQKAAELSRAIDDERRGQVQIKVIQESDSDACSDEFFALLGGRGAIAPATSDDHPAEKPAKKLFKVSDASGAVEFSEVAQDANIKRNLLDSNDVFVLDSGAEIFAWIGKGASEQERKTALHFAQDYLSKSGRPAWLPISRILEGGENEIFEHYFR